MRDVDTDTECRRAPLCVLHETVASSANKLSRARAIGVMRGIPVAATDRVPAGSSNIHVPEACGAKQSKIILLRGGISVQSVSTVRTTPK